MAVIKIKRATRAQIDSAETGSGLLVGEPYLVTDDKTMAVGVATNEYVDLPTITGAKRIAVVSSLPGSPDANTIYLVLA